MKITMATSEQQNIVEVKVDPILIDIVLFKLYEGALTHDQSEYSQSVDVAITIGAFAELRDPEAAKDLEHTENKQALDILKSSQVIEDYQMAYGTNTIIYRKWELGESAKTFDLPVHMAKCQFIPNVLFDFIRWRFKTNKAHIEQIAKLYLKLIHILEAFFNSSIPFDLKLNEYYCQVLETIDPLLRSDIRPQLQMEVGIPFRDLFIEQKQLAIYRQNPSRITGRMYDDYAHLHELINLYSLDRLSNLNLHEIDEYLAKFQHGYKSENSEESSNEPVSLKGIRFDETTASLVTSNPSNRRCQLPPYKNEFYFCKAMFEYMPNEPVDWSVIYEKMKEDRVIDKKKSRRTLYDTVEAVNKRVQETFNTKDELFSWSERTLRRNF